MSTNRSTSSRQISRHDARHVDVDNDIFVAIDKWRMSIIDILIDFGIDSATRGAFWKKFDDYISTRFCRQFWIRAESRWLHYDQISTSIFTKESRNKIGRPDFDLLSTSIFNKHWITKNFPPNFDQVPTAKSGRNFFIIWRLSRIDVEIRSKSNRNLVEMGGSNSTGFQRRFQVKIQSIFLVDFWSKSWDFDIEIRSIWFAGLHHRYYYYLKSSTQ